MSSQNHVIIKHLLHHKTHLQRRKIFSTLQTTKKNLQWTPKVAHTFPPPPSQTISNLVDPPSPLSLDIVYVWPQKFSHSNCFPKVRCVISYLYHFFSSLTLLTHGDVETNPGPKKSCLYLSCCYWNVNSLIAQTCWRYLCLWHIILYINIISFALVKQFDSSVESEDDDLRIYGYQLIRMDHPLNTKRSGVCIYYKESLVVKMINVLLTKIFLM